MEKLLIASSLSFSYSVFYPSKELLAIYMYKTLFSRVCSTSRKKQLWEKEKLLLTSNFSFSYNVFYHFEELPTISIKVKIVVCKVCEFGRVFNLSIGRALTLSQTTNFRLFKTERVCRWQF